MTLCNDPNLLVEKITEVITLSQNDDAPPISYSTKNPNLRLKSDTLKAIADRDYARRNRRPSYNFLRNRALSLVRRDSLSSNLTRIRNGGESVAWRITNEILNGRSSLLPLPEGCTTDLEAATTVNQFFTQKIVDLHSKINVETSCTDRGGPGIATDLQLDTKFKFGPVSAKDIREAARHLANKTSLGTDQIPITMIKAALPVLILPLTKLANAIILKKTWPKSWKCAIIIPTLKRGKPSNKLSSLRPVALLCAISKLIEVVLDKQMTPFLERFVFPPEQHGYRPGRSVDTATAKAASFIDEFKSKHLKMANSAYDYSSAFDTMDHEMISIVFSVWMDLESLLLLESYLSGAEQMVRWNETLSPKVSVPYGVRQGSILGPTLFIAFVSGVFSYCTGNIQNTHMIGYADDNNGFHAAPTNDLLTTKVELCAERLTSFSARHGLALNMSKTQLMGSHNFGPVQIGDVILHPQPTMEMLGTIFDFSGRFLVHNDTIAADMARRVGRVRRLTSRIPRGRLLREIGQALVVGKANCAAWVTREARLSNIPGAISKPQHVGQVALNDLARILTGHSRKDHIPVSVLIEKSGLPTLNEIVVKRSAVEAWKAMHGGALSGSIEYISTSSRATSNGMVKARTNSRPDKNLEKCWNASEELRNASTISAAKRAAKKLASESRHF